jgi:hypothetical protein
MLPSLPLVCALAAVGLDGWAPRQRLLAAAAMVALSIAFWFGPVRGHAAPDFDSNLVYRRLLSSQHQAVQTVVAARPRAVLAPFPTVLALLQPPAGEVVAPLRASVPSPGASLAELCANDLLVEPALGTPVTEARERLRAAGALGAPARYGEPGLDVAVFPIHCP